MPVPDRAVFLRSLSSRNPAGAALTQQLPLAGAGLGPRVPPSVILGRRNDKESLFVYRGNHAGADLPRRPVGISHPILVDSKVNAGARILMSSSTPYSLPVMAQ